MSDGPLIRVETGSDREPGKPFHAGRNTRIWAGDTEITNVVRNADIHLHVDAIATIDLEMFANAPIVIAGLMPGKVMIMCIPGYKLECTKTSEDTVTYRVVRE